MRAHGDAVVKQTLRRFLQGEDTGRAHRGRGTHGYKKINVEAQQRDPDSLLNWTARRIRVRKELPEIGWGKSTVMSVEAPSVLVLRYEWRNVAVVTAHNFSESEQIVHFDVRTDDRGCFAMCSTPATARRTQRDNTRYASGHMVIAGFTLAAQTRRPSARRGSRSFTSGSRGSITGFPARGSRHRVHGVPGSGSSRTYGASTNGNL